MAVIFDFGVQGAQMLLVLLLAPLLTGFTRKVKARLLLRRGPPLVQPYRDLVRLMRKEVVLADNASWLFRVNPYLIFAATWVAASLVPTFRTGLLFSWSADLIAIVALLGSARFFLALAGLDIGTSRIKAGVFDLGGRLVTVTDVPTPTLTTPEGWVEYDPEALWQAACGRLQACVAALDDPAANLLARNALVKALDAGDKAPGAPGAKSESDR